MLLEYNPASGLYFLRVPRSEADATDLMYEYGLDLSVPASTSSEAVLFTADPYAAATFGHVATPEVKERLSYILTEIERSWAPSSDRHVDVPEDKELWPFQRASIDYALSRPHALIGDEPGLGKTPIAIGIANEMQAGRVLVVCPASIRQQWCRRIREWSTAGRHYSLPASSNGKVYSILSSKRGVDDNAAWTVISYDLLRSPGLWKALAKNGYDLLILDEAHYAKTREAKRTQTLFGGGRAAVAEPLAERAGRVLPLTGTPLPNRPREAYVLARALCWEAIDYASEEKFYQRYNPMQRHMTDEGKVWVEEHIGREAELQNRLRANLMVRHLKRDVMPQLKLPIFDLIRVEETAAVKAALQAERLLDIDPEKLEGSSWEHDPELLGAISTARKMMGVAMAPQVAEYLAMLIEGGEEKLCVFAWHTEVLDIFVARLHPYGVVRVDGKDSGAAKDRKARAFVERPDVRIIIGNVMSLGTGTDGLQDVCTHALIAEADWVMGNNQQCIDRLDRGGQTGQVQADIFVAPGSLSEYVLASALRKGKQVHKVLDRRVV